MTCHNANITLRFSSSHPKKHALIQNRVMAVHIHIHIHTHPQMYAHILTNMQGLDHVNIVYSKTKNTTCDITE